MILFIGNHDSSLYRWLQSDDNKESRILCIDFSSEAAERIWQSWWVEHRELLINISEIRAIIPAAYDESVNWGFIYQSLCFLVKVKTSVDVPFIYYVLNGTSSFDQIQLRCFATSKLLRENQDNKIFKYKANVFYNSQKQRIMRFKTNIALNYLENITNAEENGKINIPDNLKILHSDFTNVFQEKVLSIKNSFLSQLQNFELQPSLAMLEQSFGSGKDDDFAVHLLGMLSRVWEQDCQGQGADNEPVINIIRTFNPFHDLTEELLLFKKNLPGFSTIVRFNTDKICPVYHEIETLADGSLAEELFKMHGNSNKNSQCTTTFMKPLNEWLIEAENFIQNLSAGNSHERRITRQERRDYRSDAMDRLESLQTMLSNLIDMEKEIFGSDINRILRKPGIFRVAYNQLLQVLFKEHLIPMVIQVWLTRHFIFFLPRWVPAPFFKRNGLIMPVLNVMLRGMHLLNLYLTLDIAQEEIKKIHEELHHIDSLSKKLAVHYNNIQKELNLKSFYFEKLQAENLETGKINFVKKSSSQNEELMKKNLLNYDEIFQNNLTCIISMAGNSFLQDNCEIKNKYETQGGLNAWVPYFYNYHEAWHIADEMIKSVSDDELIQKELSQTDILEGICAEESIEEPFECDASANEWLTWKRKGLSFVTEPFTDDMCRYMKIDYNFHEADWVLPSQSRSKYRKRSNKISIPSFINNPEWFLAKLFPQCLQHGFFQENDNKLCVAIQTWNCFDHNNKPFFFQRKTPLSLSEFVYRINSNAMKSLKAWLHWVFTIDHFKNHCINNIADNIANGDIYDVLKPVRNITKQHSMDIFKIICRVLDETQKIGHPYYGEPYEGDDPGQCFLLQNSLDSALTYFFRGEDFESSEPKSFRKNYLISVLEKDFVLLESMIRAFEDYCIFNDHEIDPG